MKRLCAWALILILALTLAGCKKEEPVEVPPNPVATITMADGSKMRFELRPDQAPNTVANFIKLANDGFYNGLLFFRTVSGVLIQAGDPLNDGTGDAGYAIAGEFSKNGHENSLTHSRGVIGMARQRHYDSASSQFYIMQGSYPEYDGEYAAFGTIMDEESLETLDAIASQPVDSNFMPLYRQTISSIKVETFEQEYEPVTTERPKYGVQEK